ncbi:hypothetical protein SAMN05444266_102482 [Chitinophaga jiangningensis]|uniref:Uncharacterized protein n=1 Tax=Chitinophaga jiangningensis TaxID=1419482 RepID=A0A1M6YUA0_9BACT|nr:hypothetical protein [Chitinophaga jiangningensis]SHL21609.1 hypothetical protein SAMN05444266_102482 [Chitinophaga jiangningensis]
MSQILESEKLKPLARAVDDLAKELEERFDKLKDRYEISYVKFKREGKKHPFKDAGITEQYDKLISHIGFMRKEADGVIGSLLYFGKSFSFLDNVLDKLNFRLDMLEENESSTTEGV